MRLVTTKKVIDYLNTIDESVKTAIVLGDKGCALRTVDKGIPRGISRGPDPCPLDKRIKDRRARIRAGTRTRTGIHHDEPCNVTFYHRAVGARCFLDL